MTMSRLLSSKTFAFSAGFLLSVVAVLPFGTARAQDLIVKYDQSQLLRLPRPVAEIIIGNPTIADVTVQAPNLLVVTGKTFGITNVISLDADRNIIQDQRVMVIREESKVVNVQKGAKRESYNCAPQCNPSLVVGDDQQYFENVGRMSERKIKFTEGNVDSGGAQGGGN
jgi:Pilus formation protein N terminal region